MYLSQADVKIEPQSFASSDMVSSVFLTVNKLGETLSKANTAIDNLTPALKGALETAPPELLKTVKTARKLGWIAIGIFGFSVVSKLIKR